VVEVEDVDRESILVEPDARVGGDQGCRLRRRQGGGLQRPPGRDHSGDTGESYGDAQERLAHIEDGTPGS
jgi:hypothetical protein